MLTRILKIQYSKGLDKLEEEIVAYHDESELWSRSGELPNAGGNLCLHVCGNLQHFIGSVLGRSGYVRNREAEFSRKNMTREELVKEIHLTKVTVLTVIGQLHDDELDVPYPVSGIFKDMTTAHFLVHLLEHLDYHLGQINYHRRGFVHN